MVIARVLTPAEIGVYSVASALVAVLHQIRSFGIANYLVQEVDLTHDRIRTAFGWTLVTSWTLALVVLAASLPAAAFYGDPGVAERDEGARAQFPACTFRRDRDGTARPGDAVWARAVLEISSTLALAGTSIALALRGFAYMSLAWGSLAGIVVGIVVANAYRPAGLPWLPSFRDTRRVSGTAHRP